MSAVRKLIECEELLEVGGKALNLGRMLRMGFDVPNGFVVTTAAYREAVEADGKITTAVREQILQTYREIGSPVVAVRSSATAEDLAGASMAGQYETYLDVQGEDALLEAVQKCWDSVKTDRTEAYLAHQKLDVAEVEMAVVVQRLAHADTAGVLFTVDPHSGNPRHALVEASWGLGEAVVSGEVQPDTLTVDLDSGDLISFVPGQPDRQTHSCLSSAQVNRLRLLALELEEKFGCPQDCEWAFEGEDLRVLQSRNITTLDEVSGRWELRRDLERNLDRAVARGEGPWVRYNLDETLPNPTPLTWSLMSRFLSGEGGFVRLYEQMGFEPSDAVKAQGFVKLWGGRIFMDLSRSPEMFFADFPYDYDLDVLQADPEASQRPPTIPSGTPEEQKTAQQKLVGVQRKMQELSKGALDRYRNELRPAFLAWVEKQESRQLETASRSDLWTLWQEQEKRVMQEFAPESLLPSMLCASYLQEMEEFLSRYYPQRKAVALTRTFSGLGEADCTLLSLQGLYELADDPEKADSWMQRFGHRASTEFELAVPRWTECPETVLEMAKNLKGAASPLETHSRRQRVAQSCLDEVLAELPRGAQKPFRDLLDRFTAVLPFRENGKDDLMRGYVQLRRTALEIGSRLGVGEHIFYLNIEELEMACDSGLVPIALLEKREKERNLRSDMELPELIVDSKSLTPDVSAAEVVDGEVKGLSISGGKGQGPARIRQTPTEAPPEEGGYVLVCPSTDPSWTPLFVRASAIVMERGGTLSHGAVVARELGIPAVVIPGATSRFEDGDFLRILGDAGVVRIGEETGETEAESDPAETDGRFEPTPVERTFGKRMGVASLLWLVLILLAVWLPDAWLKEPVFALWDACFLWMVPQLTPPGVVAVIAVIVGAGSLVLQKVLTPNDRIFVASKAVKQLKKSDADPERVKQADGKVRQRVLKASLYPLALILGLLTSLFLWMPERLDPASWNAPAGKGSVRLVASVDGEFGGPVRLENASPEDLELLSKAEQSIVLIRPPLERLLNAWQSSPAPDASLPWELRAAGEAARKASLASLKRFLDQQMPARSLTWNLRSLPERPGVHTVRVQAGEQTEELELVFGHGFAPPKGLTRNTQGTPLQVETVGDGPIQNLEAWYVVPLQRGEAFWPPVERFTTSWLPAWLLVYLLAYLPVLLIGKKVLRVP